MSDGRRVAVTIRGFAELAAEDVYPPDSTVAEQVRLDYDNDPTMFVLDQFAIETIEVDA